MQQSMSRCATLVRIAVLTVSTAAAFLRPQVFRARSLSHAGARLQPLQSSTSLGAPSERPLNGTYVSSSNIAVECSIQTLQDAEKDVQELIAELDHNKGVLLTSSYEFPGRYSRWTVGFSSPALQIEGRALNFKILPLNERGEVVARILYSRLREHAQLFQLGQYNTDREERGQSIVGRVIPSSKYFPEELRSKQPSLFSLVRVITDMFGSPAAGQFGLYGAFGYDLTFQFDEIEEKIQRDDDQRDLVLFLPDDIMVVDNQKNDAWRVKYEIEDVKTGLSTVGLSRSSYSVTKDTEKVIDSAESPTKEFQRREGDPGDFAKSVVKAKEQFRVGNLFEVVLSQVFKEKIEASPSTIFKRLSKRNPSPYGFFINLGSDEYLVGASPEMFVRVENTKTGQRIETCPISGTIERGRDALEDALQIKKLLTNPKEESELTMCTDVDRNDKSRICEPGSVRVLGRRQIELYSRLIHTVDHVEGYLRKEFDALDAFLCHTWAVTVTGAPKTWAIRFIEESEKSPRHWYGGAVGMVGFDGTLNTGLTLRTIRIKNGVGEVRSGATLLHDSDPASEEAETELKASAMLDAIVRPELTTAAKSAAGKDGDPALLSLKDKSVLLIDHEDSFVHTLANYLRQTGANVVTCRSGKNLDQFIADNLIHSGGDGSGSSSTGTKIDLAVLSPGPGSPSDFGLSSTISKMMERKIPIFGVCLGLQGLVEHFGGSLGILSYPMHGKPSTIVRKYSDGALPVDVLHGLPSSFGVARYHSLYGNLDDFPRDDLIVTAETEDGVAMAIQHKRYPIAAVQFHPESILTLPIHGMKILTNALTTLKGEMYESTGSE